jgi:purine-nucleoside phosphorylase
VELYDRIEEARAFIRSKTARSPEFGIILGTGLGGLAGEVEVDQAIPFAEIPHFEESKAPGHEGKLLVGSIGGKNVVVMQGRLHYYEGHGMRTITFPIRVMRALGAGGLVISSAVGGMNPLYRAGDLVLVVDQINLMGDNPLIGPNDDRLGPRFPDMSEPFDRGYEALTSKAALDLGMPLHRGVLVCVSGPSLETRAEYRFLRQIGADVVGMSMVPETIVAVHAGMKVLALAIVTDECFPDALEPVDVEKIIAVAGEAEPKLSGLVKEFLERV